MSCDAPSSGFSRGDRMDVGLYTWVFYPRPGGVVAVLFLMEKLTLFQACWPSPYEGASQNVVVEPSNDDRRFLGVCKNCGNVFAATKVQNGGIQPVGSGIGCRACGSTDITGVSASSGELDSVSEITGD